MDKNIVLHWFLKRLHYSVMTWQRSNNFVTSKYQIVIMFAKFLSIASEQKLLMGPWDQGPRTRMKGPKYWDLSTWTLVNGFETMLRCTYSWLRWHMDICHPLFGSWDDGSQHLGPEHSNPESSGPGTWVPAFGSCHSGPGSWVPGTH